MDDERLRLLLLDDEESLREPLKKFLERNYYYRVDDVASGEEALQKVEEVQGQYDVALIDEVLRDGPNGIEVMEQIKARYPDIECIIFTGWGTQPKQRALRAGAFRYVEKPFDVDELAMLIRTAAHQVRLRKIGRAILLERDLDKVLTQIMSAATSLSLADESSIVLRDPVTGKITVYPEISAAEPQWRRHFEDRELSKEIIESGQITRISDTAEHDGVNPGLLKSGIRSFLGVPIPGEKGNLGVLYVYSRQPGRFDEGSTVAVLQTLAGQAGLAIINARAFQQIQTHAGYMEALVQAAQGFARATAEEELFSLALDFVRKHLKYSTSFIALYDRQRDTLHFPLFYDAGQRVPVPSHFLGDDRERWGIAGYVVKTGQELLWTTGEERKRQCEKLGIQSRQVGKPRESAFFLPIKSGGEVIGVMSIQSHKPHAFPPTLPDVFRALSSQLSVSIENVRLLRKTQRGLIRLRAAYEATKEVIAALDPEQAIKVVLEKALQATEAWWVKIVFIDENGSPYHAAAVGLDKVAEENLLQRIRPQGISVKVMRSKEPRFIEDVGAVDEANPAMREEGVGAAACLPLAPRGKSVGVLWVHYREPHHFSDPERQALQLYAAQAAIAYDNARRMQELDQMREAAEAMSQAIEPQQALQRIVTSAARVLHADSAAIWSYDQVRKMFIPEELVAVGIPDDELKKFRDEEPKPGRTADTVMREHYVAVEDVSLAKYTFPGQATRELLNRIGVRSFQGIALRVGDETLGVLFANYRRPRKFDEDDRARLGTFASHAALSLKNARLLAQMRRTRKAAEVIANVTVQERLDRTLKTIAQHAQRVLRSDAVIIYSYDEARTRWGEWVAEIREPHRSGSARPPEDLKPDSAVWRILNLREPPYYCVAEDHAGEDALLSGRFVRLEGIRAAIGVQLRVGDHKVGVMFVNFHSPHRFTSEEIATIQLFADQAAVAIRNAQQYAEIEKQKNSLEALYNAGQIITSTLALEDILQRIAEQAWRLSGRHGKKPRFSHLALKEGRWLRFKAAYPPKFLRGLTENVGDIDLEGSGRIGVAGRAVKKGEPQLVEDVTQDEDYIVHDPETRSELAVPIKMGEEVIGVINVEHPDPHAFNKDDLRDLTLLAAQAAIAIQNARLYEQSRIVSRISRESAQSLDLDTFLNTLFASLKEIFEKRQIPVHLSLMTYDEDKKVLVPHPTPFYPENAEVNVVPLDGPGIMTLVARTEKLHYAPDVSRDPHYMPLLPDTRSEIAIPIMFKNELLGVLDMESPVLDAFTPQDQKLLKTLAAQVAVTLQNVRQYEELKRAKGIIGGRTALAWMGMTSSAWRHDIDKYAVTIREQSLLLRRELQKPSPRSTYIQEKLDAIERLATQILEKPIVPPLSAEEGVELVALNALIAERARQLWQRAPYKKASLQLNLQLPESAMVRTSPEWLRRAFDILVDNAVEAVAGQEVQEITIGTRRAGDGAEIFVADTGPGIPEEIRTKIGLEPIEKPGKDKGLGMGLLMARTIVQAYGGELRIGSTGPTGTTMVIWLPLVDSGRAGEAIHDD